MKKLLLTFTLVLLGCSDVVENYYADYQQAQADHLFERGWLPPILPASTTQIQVANNLDSNYSQGSFVIAEAELAQFIEQLEACEFSGLYRFQAEKSVWSFTLDTQGKVRYQLTSRAE
ncbi:hypothetical protein XV92_11635 [Vibrio metoecus]|uniref:YbbD head domain-containing protein n=1 Tax=Vibrio metoecus TaxID=1481663 RepID=A0A0Q0Q1J4_VIBMT|nr:hypothetical protein [Vibrio metoecus]KQA18880.1 hypothetical protein AAY54_09280 [Vibrio metoecus]KQA99445.1 hypothetical protein XV92_11635 [Vibrio metoecus]